MMQWMRKNILIVICLLLLLPLTGCSNYTNLFRAIRERVSGEQTTTGRPTTERTEQTTTRQTTRETTQTTTRQTTRETTQTTTRQTTTTQTTTRQTTTTQTTQTTSHGMQYIVTEGFFFEEGSIYVSVPLIEPDDAQSGPLNEELLLRAAYEAEICQSGFDEDIFYVLDYYYQFDGTCLTLALENIVGWVDSEGYFSYSVYHYDFATATFLSNIAYLEHLGLDIDLIAEMVSTFAEANLDPEWYEIRPLDEAIFVIFDNVLYYEVISLEFEDYWLEEIGSIDR